MENCDVLVIGAGPAGSTCARLLSHSGLSVLLLERDEFPRDKPCAGWVTPAVLQALGVDPGIYGKEYLLQEIHEFRTGLLHGNEIVTDYGRTVSYAVRRCEFDHFLLLRSGCRTLLGEPVTKLERDANGWVVNGWIRTRLLIGAGGHGCPVAHVLGGHPKAPPIAAMVAEFADGEDAAAVAAGSVSISFTPDLAGYGWLLRKGKFLNVGLGSLHGTKVRRQAQEYCRELKLRGLLPEDVTPRLKGHAYLPYRRHGGRRLFSERALLIGDAAGVSSPMSGEGILPSVETAIMAAQTVVAAAGDYRLETLAPYAAAVAARFGGGSGDGRDVPQQVRRLVGTALLSSRYLTRRLVLDRWFLHAGQRALDAEVETPVQWMVSEMED